MKKGHIPPYDLCLKQDSNLHDLQNKGILFFISDPTDKSADFPHFPY